MTFENLLKGYLYQVSEHWQEVLTDFFPVSDILEQEKILQHSGLYYRIDGGYEEAERARLFITQQEYQLTSENMQLSVVSFRGNTKFINFNHRDCLGALMSLGFDRKCIGDIIIYEDGFDVITNTGINDFLLISNLTIKHVPMKKQIVSIENWKAPEPKRQSKTISVQQLRLDATIAKVYNLSRATTTDLIKAKKVKLNQRLTIDASKLCQENDVVSVQGYGKFYIKMVEGINRKGKLRVAVEEYI